MDALIPAKTALTGISDLRDTADPVQFRRIRVRSLTEIAQLETTKLGSTPNVHRVGHVFLAGQPGQDDIAEIKGAGIARVLDLRTVGEVDWDEPSVVSAAGLDYTRLAFRAPDSLTDEIFDTARQAFSAAGPDNGLLCHCGSANRVGAVWLAHRVLDQNVPWDVALAEAKQVGLRNSDYVQLAKEYVEKNSN